MPFEQLVKDTARSAPSTAVTLDVPPGEIHGFLGPNGAGKTTTMRMIAGLAEADRRSHRVNGHDLETEPEAAKASLGFIPDRPFIYDKLTAGEFLRFMPGSTGSMATASPSACTRCSTSSSCASGSTS